MSLFWEKEQKPRVSVVAERLQNNDIHKLLLIVISVNPSFPYLCGVFEGNLEVRNGQFRKS